MYKITTLKNHLDEKSNFLRAYLKHLLKKDIPVFKIKDQLYQFGIGEKLTNMKALDSLKSAMISKDKNQTSYLLSACGINVPKQVLIKKDDKDNCEKFIKELKYPLVVKPADLSLSIGVTLDIKNQKQLKKALNYAFTKSTLVVIEEYVKDALDHRLTFFKDNFLGCLVSIPQYIEGDGKKTVKKLIAELDSYRKKRFNLKPRTSDWIYHTALLRHNLSYSSILAVNKKIKIYSGSGLYENISEKVHPENIELCMLATQILGLSFSGVDFMSPDASVPYYENGGTINEVNSFPDIGIYLKTPLGKKVDLGEKISNLMFPKDKDAWIPITYKGKLVTSFTELKKLLNTKPREIFMSASNKKIINNKLPLIAFLINSKVKSINI